MDDHEYMYGHTYCINGQITYIIDTHLQEFLEHMDLQVYEMDKLQDLETIQH